MIEFRFLQAVAQAEARRGKRYSITELAEGMGVSRGAVTQWLAMSQGQTNRKAIALESLAKICQFLGCTPADLLIYHEPMSAQG